MPVKAKSLAQRRGPLPDLRDTAAARGYDRAWQRLRLAYLQAHPVCVFCGQPAEVADHIVPIAVAPHRRLDWTNLRAVCVGCHNAITARFRLEGINGATRCLQGGLKGPGEP